MNLSKTCKKNLILLAGALIQISLVIAFMSSLYQAQNVLNGKFDQISVGWFVMTIIYVIDIIVVYVMSIYVALRF